jgi:hypothetical protein
MNIELLHYREWRGRYRWPIAAVWPIARIALGMLLRRRLFWVLYAVSLLIFLMFFFGGFLLDWATVQLASSREVRGVIPEPERFIQGLQRTIKALSGSQETFAYFLSYQATIVMITLAFTGSTLVGRDYVEGSVPFFLAKPISRWHYILGKCLAVAIVVQLQTTVPALVLFGRHMTADWNYLTDPDFFYRTDPEGGPAGVPLLLGIIAYGTLISVVTSIMLVAVASGVRRTIPLIMVWTFVFLFLRLLSRILVQGFRFPEHWRLLDMWNNLRLVGQYFLGFAHEQVRPLPQPATWEAIVVLVGVSLLCLMYLNRRTRAVEIVQ